MQPEIINNLSSSKHMNRVQASYILYTYLAGEQYNVKTVNYNDLNKLLDKYKKAIYFVNKIGLINGYPDNNFKPLRSMTKEAAAIILLRLFRLDNKGVINDE